MTEYSIWWTIGGVACLIALGLAVVAPGFILGFSLSRKLNQELKVERAERQKLQESIRDNGGIMAPGVIVAAKVLRSWGGGKHSSSSSHVMEYEIEITPENGLPFRVKTNEEFLGGSYTILMGEMISEHGRRVWAVYDPKEPSRAYFSHYDENHHEGTLNYRRGIFNKLTEGNEELKRTGVQAEAIITGVDDLNLPYPLKKGRAMHLYFDVMPRDGTVFRAEGNVLIGDVALEKYSVGKTVYVRFDPNQPERAVLDSERNKSIQ
jgi:hypothetical protein